MIWLPIRSDAARWAANCLVLAFAALSVSFSSRCDGEDLLPDLIAWDHDLSEEGSPPGLDIVYGGYFDTTVAGRVLYRFRAALANVGAGPLQVVEQTAEENGVKTTQTITQQILQSGGGNTFRDRTIGTFDYPPEVVNGFGHLRLPGLAQYNLYEAIVNGGATPDVGSQVRSNDKLSMGIVDSIAYNQPVPGKPPSSVYDSADADVLGISIGYADLYGAGLPGQWIDVTDLASGQYWLEVHVDPYDRVLEVDELNNTSQILVDLEVPVAKTPGDNNDDGVVDLVDYVVWRNTLGNVVATGTDADANRDGIITSLDYEVWKTNFGQTTPESSESQLQVPEPAAIVPMGALLAGLVLRVTRSRDLSAPRRAQY
ncbi:lysyl oxidase family protein [Aeoliella sp. ICT_H6.2]|uniref:Lysyl oxidase family protein n=1 Tax=Aeoliella straminimaris TaxID=2954799 RepID=A0A9X2FE03_9BACT|nr:lysyl oxidase family protein [Aeoliella straminimaris]MCO6046899.1 lysyl oxidase family protein [Aeoliella straminimaris]